MGNRLFFAALITTLAFTGGSQTGYASDKKDLFLLEDFFVGRSTGHGVFKSWIAGVHRPFRVRLRGTRHGRTLILVEDFFYDDGERDRKTWTFVRTGPDTYEGTREDVVGKAKIKAYSDRITLKYLVDVPTKNGKTRVRFSDVISKQDDGSVLNVARVSKFGLKIGSVRLVFKR